MEVKFTDKDLKIESLKNGLALGSIMLVLSLISAYLMISSTSIWAIFLYPLCLSIILPIIISVFFCKDLRKKIGGYWNFRRATSGIFIMFLTAYLLSSALNFAYSKTIEPELQTKIENAANNATIAMMEKQGVEQSQIDEMQEKRAIESEKKKNGTIMQNVQGYVIGILFVFVFALIFAAIFKKERPLFISDEQVEVQ